MATVAAKAIRRGNAESRIAEASKVLGERFGVPQPAPVLNVIRDPELRRAAESERMADLLEGIVAATGPAGADVTVTVDDGEVTTTTTMTTDLAEMTRAELDAYAGTLGLDTTSRTDYPNKGAVIEAIEEALTAPEATEAGDGDEPGSDDADGGETA